MLLNCPTCTGQFQSAEAPGTKVACPSCGQRILIPHQLKPGAQNKTVIGTVGEAPPVPVQAQPRQDYAQPAPQVFHIHTAPAPDSSAELAGCIWVVIGLVIFLLVCAILATAIR